MRNWQNLARNSGSLQLRRGCPRRQPSTSNSLAATPQSRRDQLLSDLSTPAGCSTIWGPWQTSHSLAAKSHYGCKFAVFGSCFPDCVFSSWVLSYSGNWLSASFWWHLLLIVGLWWVNIGLKFGNGNGNSQEGYANKRWNPISTNPSLSNHYHIWFSPVLDRFDSPPQSRTPKKNKSG